MPPLLVTLDDLANPPPQARLVDVRWKLGDPSAGRAMFEQGHIPGAVYVDMDTDLAAPPGKGGRHPLPEPKEFAAAMARAGIGNDTWVIAYDDGGAGAPRLWWLLRHFGHTNVSLLDGGFQAYQASGNKLATGSGSPPTPATFTATPRDDDFVDLEALQRQLDQKSVQLLDARAPERWRGDVEPVDSIPGRIPGSLSAPAGANLQDGKFRSPADLKAHYEAMGVRDGEAVVVSCGSGVSACVNLVALELAGITGARLFPGSYSNWIANDLPVDTGPR